MTKKGGVISRLLSEKGVDEEILEESFPFKTKEWVELRHKHKRGGVGAKHTKNLK